MDRERYRSSLTLLFNELLSSNASSAAHSIAFLSRFQCRGTSSSSPNKWWVTTGSAVAWQLVIDSHHTAISSKHLEDNSGHQIHQTNRYNHDDGQKVKTFNRPFCTCKWACFCIVNRTSLFLPHDALCKGTDAKMKQAIAGSPRKTREDFQTNTLPDFKRGNVARCSKITKQDKRVLEIINPHV